jgi:hypothetical protein
MAFTSSKMGLRIWNLLGDLFDHDQLADNWAKVDLHDHSPGRGVQIPTEGLADGSVTGPKLATALDPSGSYLTYKFVRAGGNVVAASQAAGVYAATSSIPSSTLLSASPTSVFYIDPNDDAVAGRSAVFRLRHFVLTNATAPAVNFTAGLYSITGITTGTPVVGAAVGTSTVITAPAANAAISPTFSTDFVLSAAGFYGLAVATSGTTAAASSTTSDVTLQVRQV